MRVYREKKKARKAAVTNPESARSEAAVIRERKKPDRTRKRMERELVKSQKIIRAEKSRNYRLRLKLRGEQLLNSTPSSNHSSPECCPFKSRSAEYRASRKVRQALPTTPIKKAHLIDNLINSPTTSKILCSRGRILNKNMVRRIKMG